MPEIAANEPLLRAMLRNLIDNALRYSPVGARIEVTLQVSLDRLLLQVAGSGLGCSIVRRIAELHGVSVAPARSEHLGGLQVRLSFPSLPPTKSSA